MNQVNMFYISLLFLSLSLFFSCGHPPHNAEQIKESLVALDSIVDSSKLNLAEVRNLQDSTDQFHDSIRAYETLQMGLALLQTKLSLPAFSFKSDSLEIDYGHLLSKTEKHVRIRRYYEWNDYVDIYKIQNNQLVNILSIFEWPVVFTGDSIFDVNGDGKNDFVWRWYPTSGCCPRDIHEIYIQNSRGAFGEPIEVENPEFSPKEKVIRGLCYGYNAPLYKYKWNGNKLDTIEYIYFPDPDANRKTIIRSKTFDEDARGEALDSLPKEYKDLGLGPY